jgi:hypothetical protein
MWTWVQNGDLNVTARQSSNVRMVGFTFRSSTWTQNGNLFLDLDQSSSGSGTDV